MKIIKEWFKRTIKNKDCLKLNMSIGTVAELNKMDVF